MFQIEKRGNTINFNEKEWDEINAKLKTAQEIVGEDHLNVKSVFLALLERVITEKSREIEKEPIIEKVEIIPENALILPENSEDNEFRNNVNLMLKKFPELQEEFDWFKTFDFAVKSALNEPEIKEITKELELGPFDFLVTLTDEPKRPKERKLAILEKIQVYREAKYGVKEEIPQIIEKLTFTEGSIFDVSGEYKTGFSGFQGV